ncbi:hypothetical protein N7452_011392 [Penicillium brevicompactum]|uniref:Uncharacterized protein n=1 Tax=Penicillium brevicompactum TaxID=5074 RepID=A0A9W9U7Y9_PENBR|nr:hypothetical protein N7452_011392 [Penicillium brevicompactum]
MKPFFTLTAFTALFQVAYSFDPGVYIIALALEPSTILEDTGSGQPLRFETSPLSTNGFWTFATTDHQFFTIQNQPGDYITCETTGDKICSLGKKPQSFELLRSADDDAYVLVEKTSKLFLRLLPQAPKEPGLQLGSNDVYAKFNCNLLE